MTREVRFLNAKQLATMHWTAVGAFLLCHSYSKWLDKTEDYFYKHAVDNGIIFC